MQDKAVTEYLAQLGRRGGRARAEALSAERRREIAAAASQAAQQRSTPAERSERARRASRARWARVRAERERH